MFLDSPESPEELGKVAHQSSSGKTFGEQEGHGTLKLDLFEGQSDLQADLKGRNSAEICHKT